MRSMVWLLAVSACSEVHTGPAPDSVQCEVSETPLAADDDELGFSAAEVLARFGGERPAALEYYEGGMSDLTLELTLAGEAAHVVAAVPDGVDPAAVAGPCGWEYMRLPVELRFATADGRFAERIPATWELEALGDYGNVNEYVAAADLKGSYTGEADRLSFSVVLGAGEPSGTVVGVVDVEGDLGTEFNVARFNVETWPQSE